MGKKKDKKDKKKKDKKKKDKKDKKKKDKKSKKKASSSSSSSDGSGSSASAPTVKKQKKDDAGEEEIVLLPPPAAPKVNLDSLPPPEEGIQRFIFTEAEVGPLGLRFSGGFPPMILSLIDDSFAAKKKIPVNFEVHAINGNGLIPQNIDVVMSGLKMRPVALDVRPLGWKPKEKVKELERIRERQEAERQAIQAQEEIRRAQVAQESAERNEREASERAEKEAVDKAEAAVFMQRAREQRAATKEKEQAFEVALSSDPKELRKAAEELMQADYGSSVKVEGRRGLPLRLLSRRKEVAWMWYAEAQELIGGGVQDDPVDSWSEGG